MTLPQLECWNAGIVEKWILEYWDAGLMVEGGMKKQK